MGLILNELLGMYIRKFIRYVRWVGMTLNCLCGCVEIMICTTDCIAIYCRRHGFQVFHHRTESKSPSVVWRRPRRVTSSWPCVTLARQTGVISHHRLKYNTIADKHFKVALIISAWSECLSILTLKLCLIGFITVGETLDRPSFEETTKLIFVNFKLRPT